MPCQISFEKHGQLKTEDLDGDLMELLMINILAFRS